MKNILKNINWNIFSRGDKVVWAMMVILLIFSLLGVISTGTIRQVSSVPAVCMGWARDILVAFVVMYIAYLVPFSSYRWLAKWSVVIAVALLIWATIDGQVIAGQSAGRWVRIFGISFQPSALALISMVMYTAVWLERYRHEKKEGTLSPWEKWLVRLWIPVMLMFFLIVIHNLSTGIIYLATYYVLLMMGGFSWRQTCISILLLLAMGMSVYGVYKVSPDTFDGSRVETWVSRIDSWVLRMDDDSSEDSGDKDIQANASVTAIALGVVDPAGPGKSIQKYFLSQADSDFIYAILVEEYGLLGGMTILICFITILLRMVMQVFRSNDMFCMLTLAGLLCVMMLQAIIHMSVVVGIAPVTGQNLPFISSGGTSIMMSCLSVAIMQKIITYRQGITQMRKEAKQNAENSSDGIVSTEEQPVQNTAQ